jgi:hypothetical protein
MAILKRLLLGGVIVSTAACTRVSEPFSFTEAHHTIHALLVEGEREVAILIQEFDPRTRRHSLTQAEVEIVTGLDTLAAVLAPSGQRCDSWLPAEPVVGCYAVELTEPLRAGEAWYILVRFADGTEASGRTVIPAPPILHLPEERSRIPIINGGQYRPNSREPLALIPFGRNADPVIGGQAWSFDVLSAWSAEALRLDSCQVPLRNDANTIQDNRTERLLPIWSATCGADALVSWDSMAVRMKVVVYDTTYVQYVRHAVHGDAVRKPFASAGLDGAYGFFAAAASAERSLVFVSQP